MTGVETMTEVPFAGVSLQVRIRRAIAGAVGLALVLFAVPLAIAVAYAVRDEQVTALQRDGTRVVTVVPDETFGGAAPVVVPSGAAGSRVGIYGRDGIRVGGAGPRHSSLAAATIDGQEHDGREGATLAAAVPVISDGAVAGAVRVWVPVSRVGLRIAEWWISLALLAAAVVVATAVVGRRLARRVAGPVEQMTVAARALGAGRFDIAVPTSGLREADEAAAALQETARRLGATVERERTFNRDLSHQLRTPLTGLLTGLESALAAPGDDADCRDALRTALARGRRLQTTIDDLLNADGADGAATRCDAVAEVRGALDHLILPAGRRTQLRAEEVPPVACPPGAIRQALSVLIDNAVLHGTGPITVTVERVGGVLAIEVADEGDGFGPDSEAGTGLRLAEDLMRSVGGSLLIRRRAPRPRVALLVPVLEPLEVAQA